MELKTVEQWTCQDGTVCPSREEATLHERKCVVEKVFAKTRGGPSRKEIVANIDRFFAELDAVDALPAGFNRVV